METSSERDHLRTDTEKDRESTKAKIKELSEAGKQGKEIAAELGISQLRLFKKNTYICRRRMEMRHWFRRPHTEICRRNQPLSSALSEH
jgi:hypothetical protein